MSDKYPALTYEALTKRFSKMIDELNAYGQASLFLPFGKSPAEILEIDPQAMASAARATIDAFPPNIPRELRSDFKQPSPAEAAKLWEDLVTHGSCVRDNQGLRVPLDCFFDMNAGTKVPPSRYWQPLAQDADGNWCAFVEPWPFPKVRHSFRILSNGQPSPPD